MESKETRTLHPRDLLRQVAASMNGRHNDLSVTIPSESTWKAAIRAAEAALGDVDESMLVMPPGTGSRRRLREMALGWASQMTEDSPTGPAIGRPIRSSVDLETVQPPPPRSEAARQRLREMALKAAQEEFRQPYLTIPAGETEGYIPTVRGKLTLRGLDFEEGDPICEMEVDMVFDTGAHRTIIAEELLSEWFRQYLKDPVHDPYRSASGTIVQVDASIALSNCPVVDEAVAMVLPASQMPNKRVGVLFGQASCIDRLSLRLVPRSILRAKGEEVSEEFWGDIVVDDYLNLHGQLVPL